jgi:hypothetical protein
MRDQPDRFASATRWGIQNSRIGCASRSAAILYGKDPYFRPVSA